MRSTGWTAARAFWRNFDVNNQTQTRDVVYLVESVFHEMMLQVLQ